MMTIQDLMAFAFMLKILTNSCLRSFVSNVTNVSIKVAYTYRLSTESDCDYYLRDINR